MALLFCDNFENWSSNSSNNPGPWQMANGVDTGGGAGNVNISIPGVYRPQTTGGAGFLAIGYPNNETIIVNTRIAFANSNFQVGNRRIINFLDAGTTQCGLTYMNNGYLNFGAGTSGDNLASSLDFFPINSDAYYDIELKVRVHNTLGSVELRINGVQQFSVSNVNTRSTSNNFSNVIRIGPLTGNTICVPFFKQFILMDTTGSVMNDFIGPVDVTSLRPNADGEYDDWTANTGTRFAAVNQAVTDGDTTFVSSSTPGDQVTFQLGNLPSGVTDVFAVFPQMQIRREQGTTRICKFLMRSGIDDELGAKELAIGPTYAFRQEAITTSPFTTNAWDVAEVNGLELGVEITT